MNTPSHTALSVQQFFTKNLHDPRSPPTQLTQSHPRQLLFVSQDEKSPQRERFCRCGRGETKNGKGTKRHQNRQVQKLF